MYVSARRAVSVKSVGKKSRDEGGREKGIIQISAECFL
jgi:hypothetical protein